MSKIQMTEAVSKAALSADELRGLASDISDVALGNAYSERVLRAALDVLQAQPDTEFVRAGKQVLGHAIAGQDYSFYALQDVAIGLVRLADGKDYAPVIHPWESYAKAKGHDGSAYDVYVRRDDDVDTGRVFNVVKEGGSLAEVTAGFVDLNVLLASSNAQLLHETVGTLSFISVDNSQLSDAQMNERGMLGDECVRLHDANGNVIEALEIERDEQAQSLTICSHYSLGSIDEQAHKKLLCKLNEQYDLSVDPTLFQTAQMLRNMAGLSSAQDLGQMVVRRGTLKLEREMVVTADVDNDGPSCGM